MEYHPRHFQYVITGLDPVISLPPADTRVKPAYDARGGPAISFAVADARIDPRIKVRGLKVRA